MIILMNFTAIFTAIPKTWNRLLHTNTTNQKNWLLRFTLTLLRPFARHLVGKMVIQAAHEYSSRYAQPRKKNTDLQYPPFKLTYVPGSKLPILGMVIQPLVGNPYYGYINPYYWVDDHTLLYGNHGSLDPIAHIPF